MLESIQKELEKGLDPKHVSKRRQGGMMVSYIEGYHVIEEANKIFGYGGWSYDITSCDVHDTDKGYESVAIVKLRVDCNIDGGWITRTDVGTGSSTKKMGRDLCVKQAVTDALKRSFRTFGSRFGNSLYDKENAIHSGGEDDHAKKPDPYDEKESGQIMQQFMHDLVACHTMDDWSKACKFYKDDIKRLSSSDQENMREAARERKTCIEKLTEGEV